MADAARDLLFICYSHTDQKYRDQFQKFLKADALKGLLLDADVLRALRNPRPLKDFVPDCDTRVSDIVMRMLSPDPKARWDSMREVEQRLEDALTNASSIAAAKESYREFAQDPAFYEELYKRLFDKIPGIEGKFISRTMDEQREVLRSALWLLLTFPSTGEKEEPTILSRIAHTHRRFPEAWFDTFGAVLLGLVKDRHPEAAEAWRYAMAPGLRYLKEHAAKAASAGARES